jgi:sugar phosphate isomerase/epimerase
MNALPLVAMENCLFSDPPLDWERRYATIAAAGFVGVYAVTYPLFDDDLPCPRDLAATPARHGLRVCALYLSHYLAFAPDHPVNARVARVFAEMAGAPRIELSFKCSDPGAFPATTASFVATLDDPLLARLDPLLAIADRRGFDVALYPHSFYSLEPPAHAARLVRRAAHPRLSYLFATSHVYAVSTPADTLAQLVACAGEITSFNVCGCRRSAPGSRAKCIHLALDDGDLPLAPLFAALDTSNYAGDVIIQGHGWKGDLPALLSRSRLYSPGS